MLSYFDSKIDSALSFVTDGVRILDLYVVRNPDKLRSCKPVRPLSLHLVTSALPPSHGSRNGPDHAVRNRVWGDSHVA